MLQQAYPGKNSTRDPLAPEKLWNTYLGEQHCESVLGHVEFGMVHRISTASIEIAGSDRRDPAQASPLTDRKKRR
jgi:hypothetical protein